jgi:hypothetical protein
MAKKKIRPPESLGRFLSDRPVQHAIERPFARVPVWVYVALAGFLQFLATSPAFAVAMGGN